MGKRGEFSRGFNRLFLGFWFMIFSDFYGCFNRFLVFSRGFWFLVFVFPENKTEVFPDFKEPRFAFGVFLMQDAFLVVKLRALL